MLISNLSLNYEILVNESITMKIIDDGRSEYANMEVHQQDVISRHSANICLCNAEVLLLIHINIVYIQI